ncbi:SDR family oxidoreductase [Ferviditalea candida]|uniref:SDR family oxidoreductase n=1 Tax=Ferviditalea candida TaxID=3108399 RepID=A0ABU5ZN12_9BACL|nr:SDR family oxidoreductase [Paenibacillaceae bacterium T2]
MDLGFKGSVAVVTAASKGLGAAIAEELAREGANLVLCSRDQISISVLADRLSKQYGVKTLGLAADVSLVRDIDMLIDHTMSEFGRVDALLCNAGGPKGGSFLSMTDEDWEKAFQTNLMSTVRLIRGFYPHLKVTGGKIVTIASSSVKIPIPGLVLSNTFRAGVAGLMKTLASELGPSGILLNTVSPGRILTDRVVEIDEARAQREGKSLVQVQQEVIQEIPLGRYGQPKELAVFAAFLLSKQNTYVTGSTFFIDGGMVKAL